MATCTICNGAGTIQMQRVDGNGNVYWEAVPCPSHRS